LDEELIENKDQTLTDKVANPQLFIVSPGGEAAAEAAKAKAKAKKPAAKKPAKSAKNAATAKRKKK
jgi:hypothetical protein